MSNWCPNKLAIVGSKENLTIFKSQVKGTETAICLDNLVPMPKELECTISPGEEPNWYDWRVRNWGIQWNVEARLIDESEDGLIYDFESLWCSPYGWTRKIAPTFPDLSFELYYGERGTCVQGTIIAEKDLFIKEEEDYFEEMEFDEDLEEVCEDYQEIISIVKEE